MLGHWCSPYFLPLTSLPFPSFLPFLPPFASLLNFVSILPFLHPLLSPQLSVKIARHEEEVTDSLISHERRMLVVEKGSSGAPRRLNTNEGDVDGSEEGAADGMQAKQVSATILSSATTLFDTDHLFFPTMTVPFYLLPILVFMQSAFY
jgi:hypothetical protein